MLLQALGLPAAGTDLAQLTVPQLQNIVTRLLPKVSVNVTEELRQAAVGLLQGKDINTVSDLVKSPESIQQLIGMLTGQHAAIVLDPEDGGTTSSAEKRRGFFDCPTCNFVNLIEFYDHELPKAFVCMHCNQPFVKD